MPSAANGSIGSGPEQPKQDEGACVETPAWMLKRFDWPPRNQPVKRLRRLSSRTWLAWA
jgi:hypothetical protein